MTPLYLILPICLVAAYGIHLFFSDRAAARAHSKAQTEDILCRLELISSALAEFKAYPARMDTILKTTIAEFREIVKFEETKVRSTQAKAYSAVK